MFTTDSDKLILFNMNEGKVLFEQNSASSTEVASLTKIMTAILALENCSLSDEVTITEEMVSGLDEFVVAGLVPGQVLSVEELLHLTLLPSDGDAAQALAIHTAGSIEDFAKLMNAKAALLNLTDTHFSNPVGKDTDNYSSAADIADLLIYALKNDRFREIFETFEYYSPTLGKTIYKTTSDFGVLSGAKTGFTYAAGRCLASTATLNDVSYLLVNLNANPNSNNHVRDALTVYDYFSSNYSYQEILGSGDLVVSLPVEDSEQKSLDVLAAETATAYLKNDFDLRELTYNFDGVEKIDNGFKMGDLLGKYTILNGDDLLYETELFLETEIEFYPYWLWNTAAVGGFLVLIIGVVIFAKKKRASNSRRARVNR